ncbi:MAG: hypothetical protein KAJ51_07040, partial [Thermoplasmata archaeon]|nr:hypothetical protein [Thermoplasmata archaeon]
ADGNLLNYWPEWKTSGGGTIDNSGNFTATRPGNWTIYSNISGISGTAIVDVTLGQLNQIIIFPSYSVITTDDNIQFYANGHDSDGNIIDIDPRWEVSGGGIIDGDGNFSATTPGNWTIYANDSGISSTAIIKIILGELKYISVYPSPLSMTTDDSMQFSANGYDPDKNLIDIEPNWDTTGGGTINETGYFDAIRPGTWIIFANLSGVSGNAIVNITLGKLANLELNPPSPNINIGDSIKFSVTCYDADGNLVDIIPDWQVSGGGNIDQTGNFTAQEAGNWTVTVTYNGVSTSTNIIINPLDEEPDDGEEDTTISYTIIGIVVIMIFLVILLIFLFDLKKKPIEELEDLEREQIIEE